jgi:beta-glucosidase
MGQGFLTCSQLADSTSAVKGASFGNPLPTACFPNTAALAATWNRDLLEGMGKAVAGQAKYKAAQVVLGPTINIHRDPRGGRNFESFSEDPVLTGHLAAALVNGIQSQGMGTCLKHFVCNECETFRKKYSANVGDRALREIYMAPFQWVLRETRPTAVMTA